MEGSLPKPSDAIEVIPCGSWSDGSRRRRSSSPRLLIVAHNLHPHHSMESRLSWERALDASQNYRVSVISALFGAPSLQGEPLRAATESVVGQAAEAGFHVLPLHHNRTEMALFRVPNGFYPAYRLWHRRAGKLAERLHAHRPWSLIHQLSYCGFREPGACWLLPVPFVWGPIGGTQAFPLRYLPLVGLQGGLNEIFRNVVNYLQLTCSRRVGQALQVADVSLAANHKVARDLRRARDCQPLIQLETGIHLDAVPRRPPGAPDATHPLRVLWAGRLEPWKGLPLLLHAAARLAPGSVHLQILGAGSCEKTWRRLAARLGISDRVEWLGWPDYDAQRGRYCEADAFAFTSLRDTSGTGLLEALAAGLPIVGLDHQGAADIMTDDCAVRIAVRTPATTIASFAEAFSRLQRNGGLYERLAAGALERSQLYSWARHAETFSEIYHNLLAATKTRPALVPVYPLPVASAPFKTLIP